MDKKTIMRTEIKVALIGGLAIIASAVIAGMFGLFRGWFNQDINEQKIGGQVYALDK